MKILNVEFLNDDEVSIVVVDEATGEKFSGILDKKRGQ
jgi:hypothetical protein